MTVFDEASGEHSLLDSMRLLADQYRQARPGFVAKEHAAYPASYEKARAGQVPRLPGRIVLDLAGLPAAANLTGISRVQLELARGFAALAAQGLMEFAVTAFDGDDFRPAQLTDTASAAKPWGTQVADGSFAFRPGDQLLLVEMRPTFLEGILPRLVAARRAGAMSGRTLRHGLPGLAQSVPAGGEPGGLRVTHRLARSRLSSLSDLHEGFERCAPAAHRLDQSRL
jgi:hypothetical protein